VNIYPGQIDHILSQVSQVGSEFQVLLDRGKDGKDYMTIRVERAEKGDRGEDRAATDRIENLISHQLLVSGKVEVVDHQSLPRTERKSKRVFDNR
jgi:phenylacetate-CoA ligase